MNLLIIEDNNNLLETLYLLLKNDFNVITAQKQGDAIDILENSSIDIVILDRSLENDDDGILVAEYIKSNFFKYSQPPHLIIISSKGKDEDINYGLSLHADYYVPKPLNIRQLMHIIANVKSRRRTIYSNDGIISFGNITIRGLNVYYMNKIVPLSKHKFILLKLFMKHIGTIFSRDDLLDILYAGKSFTDINPRIIDTYICELKKTFSLEKHLSSIYGKGYIFEP